MKHGYVPALDGLRAVAIAAVVLYHATDFTFPASGLLGVDLFFVLSGFLITTLLLGEHDRQGSVSFRSFYRRRALRLFPAVFVLLGVFLAASVVVADAKRALLGVVAGLGYVTNLVLAAGHVEDLPFGLTHLWSLSAEEQFYLVWPLILFVLFRARLGLAMAACAAGVLLTQLRALDLMGDGASTHRIAFGVDTRSLPILAGCLLALLLAARPATVKRVARPLEALALVLFVGLAIVDWERNLFAGPLLAAALCSCVLVVCALDREGPLTRALSVGPMVFLGRISYSLYLWHVPVLVAFGIFGAGLTLMAVPAVGLAVLAAVASYYLIELPFLRKKRRASHRVDTRETGHADRDRVRLAEGGT